MITHWDAYADACATVDNVEWHRPTIDSIRGMNDSYSFVNDASPTNTTVEISGTPAAAYQIRALGVPWIKASFVANRSILRLREISPVRPLLIAKKKYPQNATFLGDFSLRLLIWSV